MILFVDTSVLVKLYIEEPGTERMRMMVAQTAQVAASMLAFAEMHATFARRHREGALIDPEFQELRSRFNDDWEEVMLIPVGSESLALVPGLCDRHPLRGADAVHLAGALLLHQEGLKLLFACSDNTLLQAAASEGLATFNPALQA